MMMMPGCGEQPPGVDAWSQAPGKGPHALTTPLSQATGRSGHTTRRWSYPRRMLHERSEL